MSDEPDPVAERATAELSAIPGALERARAGSAQTLRGEFVELEALDDNDAGAAATERPPR